MESQLNMGGDNPGGFRLRENIPESKQVLWLSGKRPCSLCHSWYVRFEHKIH